MMGSSSEELRGGSPMADTVSKDSAGTRGELSVSRRQALLALGAAMLGGGQAYAQQERRRNGPWKQTIPSLDLKLVRRITMGLSEYELGLVAQMGYDGYLEYHLDHLAIDDSALQSMLGTYNSLTMEPWQLYALGGTPALDLTDAQILRSALSRRQLYERMVEFWTDHFNIYIYKGECQYLKIVDDRDVIRPHALGRFPDLLSASVHSPAMLVYLDNVTSKRLNPNENYARELLELHTLGVNGGYTQTDVIEVARCLTGWTRHGSAAGTDRGRFYFQASNHDNNAKRVLGVDIPANGGQQDGELVIQILAAHPSTARYIASKLCRWFWGESPPESLIDSAAARYAQTGGDIKAMLRVILARESLALAPIKFKRPYHLAVSALRAVKATINSPATLRSVWLPQTGQTPFRWVPPDGYPDSKEFWMGLLAPRWNIGFSMFSPGINGVSVSPTSLLQGANTAETIANRINYLLFGGEMRPPDLAALKKYLLPDPPSATRISDAFALALASPSFQWY